MALAPDQPPSRHAAPAATGRPDARRHASRATVDALLRRGHKPLLDGLPVRLGFLADAMVQRAGQAHRNGYLSPAPRADPRTRLVFLCATVPATPFLLPPRPHRRQRFAGRSGRSDHRCPSPAIRLRPPRARRATSLSRTGASSAAQHGAPGHALTGVKILNRDPRPTHDVRVELDMARPHGGLLRERLLPLYTPSHGEWPGVGRDGFARRCVPGRRCPPRLAPEG